MSINAIDTPNQLAENIIEIPQNQYFIYKSQLYSPNDKEIWNIDSNIPSGYLLDKNTGIISGLTTVKPSIFKLQLYSVTNTSNVYPISLKIIGYEEMKLGINILLLENKKIKNLNELFNSLKTLSTIYTEKTINESIYIPENNKNISQIIIHFSFELSKLEEVQLLIETEDKEENDYNVISCYIDNINTTVKHIMKNERSFLISETLECGIHTIYLIINKNIKIIMKWLSNTEKEYYVINSKSNNIKSFSLISSSYVSNSNTKKRERQLIEGYCDDGKTKFGEYVYKECPEGYGGEICDLCTGNENKLHWENVYNTCKSKRAIILFNKTEYLYYVNETIMIDISVECYNCSFDFVNIPYFLKKSGNYLIGKSLYSTVDNDFFVIIRDIYRDYLYELKLLVIDYRYDFFYEESELKLYYGNRLQTKRPLPEISKVYYYIFPSLPKQIYVDFRTGVIIYSNEKIDEIELNNINNTKVVIAYSGNYIYYSNIITIKYKSIVCNNIDDNFKETPANKLAYLRCPINGMYDILRKCKLIDDTAYWSYTTSKCDLYSYCPEFQSFPQANIGEKSLRKCGNNQIGYESRECMKLSNGKASWGLINSDNCIEINPVIYYSGNVYYLYENEEIFIEPIKIYQIKEGTLEMNNIPEGLCFNKYTGVIFGNVTHDLVSIGITISGVGIDDKTYSTVIFLTFTTFQTEVIIYNRHYAIYIGIEIMDIAEALINGAVSEFTIVPELPNGLHISHTTGKIYGKIKSGTNPQPPETYTVTETRSGISSNIVIETIQLKCDEIQQDGIIWPSTNVGDSVIMNCPTDYEGLLKRKCIYENETSKWTEIDGICQVVNYYCISNLYPKTPVGETAYRECESGLHGSKHSTCSLNYKEPRFLYEINDCKVTFSYDLSINNQIFIPHKPFILVPSFSEDDNIIFSINYPVDGLKIDNKTGLITGTLSISRSFTVVGKVNGFIGRYEINIKLLALYCVKYTVDYLSISYDKCDNDFSELSYRYKYRKCDVLVNEDSYKTIHPAFSDYNDDLCKENKVINYNIGVKFGIVDVEFDRINTFESFIIRTIFVELMKRYDVELEHSDIIIQKNNNPKSRNYLLFDVLIDCKSSSTKKIYDILSNVTEDEISSIKNTINYGSEVLTSTINIFNPYFYEKSDLHNNKSNSSVIIVTVVLSIIIVILIIIIAFILIKLQHYKQIQSNNNDDNSNNSNNGNNNRIEENDIKPVVPIRSTNSTSKPAISSSSLPITIVNIPVEIPENERIVLPPATISPTNIHENENNNEKPVIPSRTSNSNTLTLLTPPVVYTSSINTNLEENKPENVGNKVRIDDNI